MTGQRYAGIFMHTDAERKYAAKAARVWRASSGEGHSPTRFMRFFEIIMEIPPTVQIMIYI